MNNIRRVSLVAALVLSFCSLSFGQTPATVSGLSSESQKTENTLPQATTVAEVLVVLAAQQEELLAQRTLIEAQDHAIARLRDELDALQAPPVVAVAYDLDADEAREGIEEVPAHLSAQVDPPAALAAIDDTKPNDESVDKQVAEARVDDPTKDTLADFTGSLRLPGTEAALRIGGFVKATLANSFDPLEVTDRFIVGSIPISEAPGVVSQSSLSASQSRFNFDLREATDHGILRAFIEGDFAAQSDTFRLRHAFGQWDRLLVGKTWSAFVDTQASPEEVDFEGLNGRANVRQSQIRVMPRIGKQFEFQLSLEDPTPQVEGADAVNRWPDLIVSGRFDWNERLHMKLGLMTRQIRVQPNSGNGTTAKETGWGVTLSGSLQTPLLDERDRFLFQLNTGSGIGRYINDLSSVGNFDGIIDTRSGDLELFEVRAGYASFQHWWGRTLRSNFTIGIVDVDNPSFVSGDAYQRTLRASTNLFWSPTPRISVGYEFLWGRRENEDGASGDAMQLQVAAKYSF